MPRPPSYRAQRPILVRAPLHADLAIPPLPDLREDGHAAAAARRTWLEEVWADDRLAEAVRHASPSLGSTLDTLAGSPAADAQAVRQAVRAGSPSPSSPGTTPCAPARRCSTTRPGNRSSPPSAPTQPARRPGCA